MMTYLGHCVIASLPKRVRQSKAVDSFAYGSGLLRRFTPRNDESSWGWWI